MREIIFMFLLLIAVLTCIIGDRQIKQNYILTEIQKQNVELIQEIKNLRIVLEEK
jgi:hypothetical protein